MFSSNYLITYYKLKLILSFRCKRFPCSNYYFGVIPIRNCSINLILLFPLLIKFNHFRQRDSENKRRNKWQKVHQKIDCSAEIKIAEILVVTHLKNRQEET